MSKEVSWEGNVYFEMESKQATGAGLYDEIQGTTQRSPEKHVAEKSEQISTEPANSNSPSEAVMLKRLLCIIVAVVAVCFLISAVTLILVSTMMISARSTPITSTDCSGDAVQNPWQKLNKDPICFGARNDSDGSFSITRTGRIKAMKLVHKSVFRNAVNVTEGQELQIWYGQDFADCGESNNSGTTYVDVYAWYTNL